MHSNNGILSNGAQDELVLLRMYMKLTGVDESGARNVFMYVVTEHHERVESVSTTVVLQPAPEEPAEELVTNLTQTRIAVR